MSLVEALATIIQTEGVATKGTNLFIAAFPEDKTSGIMLRPYGGPVEPDFEGKLHKGNVQATIRGPDYPTARALAYTLFGKMFLRQRVAEGILVYECNPITEPLMIGRETSGVQTFVLNFDATWRQN